MRKRNLAYQQKQQRMLEQMGYTPPTEKTKAPKLASHGTSTIKKQSANQPTEPTFKSKSILKHLIVWLMLATFVSTVFMSLSSQ